MQGTQHPCEMKNANKLLVWKLEEWKSLGIPKHGTEDNIKMTLKQEINSSLSE